MKIKKQVYAEILELYKKKGLSRRFRMVKDGLWIFPQNSVKSSNYPVGIFVSDYDWSKNKRYVIEIYLPNVDDELAKKIEERREK